MALIISNGLEVLDSFSLFGVARCSVLYSFNGPSPEKVNRGTKEKCLEAGSREDRKK